MADNIKIIGNILNTTTVTRYSSDDINLIASQEVKDNFGGKNDYIEFYVYDIGGNLLNTNYNYLDYKLPTNIGLTPGTNTQPNTTGNIQTSDVGVDSTLASSTGSLYPIIEIDPVIDLQNLGYSSGEFNVRYNFFQNKISDYSNRALYVKEISSDRTEIRLASTTLSDSEIESTVNSIINEINNSTYYIDNLLNFGNGEQYVAVNVALNKASSGYEVLFKMYEPLPQSIQLKSALWVVHEKVDPYIFDINLDKLVLATPGPTLRGPNFDIPIPNQGTVATSYTTYGNLVNSLQSLQQTSYNQLSNLITSQSADINVDYTNFDDFVFFGSAKQRLSNFYDKVQQIESYNNLITTYTAQTASVPSLQTEISQYSSNVNNIINQFDGYEYYLYFESSSYAWPKVSSTKPYALQSTGSVSTWYNNLIDSAQDYDDNNYDNLKYAIPTYLRDDANNAPFLTFLNMVGHYFDNIWIYINSITDINLANNNLEEGISKDLVYERLKSLGVKLYNSQAGEALSNFLVGANTGSSTFDNNFTITGSYLNNIPRKDLVSELYKRIYHNLPLLAKTKGTAIGLGYLTTIFGITGSILNVKEYGGSTKNNLLNEYSTEKVRIVYNTVEDNVLSPNHSLQAQTTVYDNFRSEDTHYVDISFSPQTQIDTYAANAIHSQNPTWSLDDYIGDPRQQYSSSYGDLVTQRTKYYQTGVTGYPGFTGSLMDYNGFIRLIQYFDNALFKMLADYVPERTSLSTGVTINSPALERNKVVYSVPNVATQSVYTAQYSASSISPQYGHFYDVLQGDKKPYYDGNISGSTVDVHQYFVDNYNNYLGNWDVYNSQHSATQNINTNTFLHSDWNVLLNNVSSSVLSTKRKDIEYIYGTTGSILKPAELQDSYLTLRSYNISRYEGSKLTSLTYNTYTSASYTGSNGLTIQRGDLSYGKTAVIDRNSIKTGLFTQIESSSFLPKRNNISLKYLVDDQGSLTELNQQNNNWFEVQNIFKAGKQLNVAQFDKNKFSNQRTLDGSKIIFNSGYSYWPILYAGPNDQKLYFQYTGADTAKLFSANNSTLSNLYISGASNPQYPAIASGSDVPQKYAVYNIFNYATANDNLLYSPGSSTAQTFASYSVPEFGNYDFRGTFDINLSFPTSGPSASFTFNIKSGSTVIATGNQQFSAGYNSYPYMTKDIYDVYQYDTLWTGLTKTNYNVAGLSGPLTLWEKPIEANDNTIVQTVPAGTILRGFKGTKGSISTPYLTPEDYCMTGSPVTFKDWSGDPDLFSFIYYTGSVGGTSGLLYGMSPYATTYWSAIFPTPTLNIDCGTYANQATYFRGYTLPVSSTSTTLNFDVDTGVVSLNKGDKIYFELIIDYISTNNYTASINTTTNNLLNVTLQAGNTGNNPFASGSRGGGSNPFISQSFSPNLLILNTNLSSFKDYLFLPTLQTGSNSGDIFTSSLYSTYGDVNYTFSPKSGDILLTTYNGQVSEFTIASTSVNSNGNVLLYTKPNLPSSLLVNNRPNISSFLFLTQQKDETNAIIYYTKAPGKTSYGLVVPDDLNINYLNNIDTITKQVKQKLLADQQGTTQ